MHIDTAMAARFLAAFARESMHTFQTCSDAKNGSKALNRVVHGSLTQRAVKLQELNLKGAGVFVMVNRGDGYGRKAINAVGVRSLFVDLDGAPLQPVLDGPIAPHIVVESSPGKWHCYWPVADMPLARFTEAQKALALRFDGDPKVADRSRVMRLPGFLHNKGAPFQTRLVQCSDCPPLTWHELVESFGLEDRMRLPDTVPQGERNATLFKLALSAARKGVPEAEQLQKAEKVNAKRCQPPLLSQEVAEVVASAYRRPVEGSAAIPLAVVDSAAYRGLDDSTRQLLLLAYRRADGYNAGIVTLPWSELREWFPDEDRFYTLRKRAVASGLLRLVHEAAKAMPNKGRGPKAGFYGLAIPPVFGGYTHPPIPPIYRGPEALQASAPDAPDALLAGGGHSKRAADQSGVNP